MTTMRTSRSVNQPLGRNHFFVSTAEAGIRKNDASPMRRVIKPSIRKSHLYTLESVVDAGDGTDLHPAHPRTPRMWRMPNAMNDVTIVVKDRAVQKILSHVRHFNIEQEKGSTLVESEALC